MPEKTQVLNPSTPANTLTGLRFAYEHKLTRRIFERFGRPACGKMPENGMLLQMRRRHLLGDAVRLTPSLLPEIWRAFTQCLNALEISEQAGGLYVLQSSDYNANVMSDGERFDIVIHSSLLRDFSLPELRFVIGHELGHVLFRHDQISLQGIFQTHDEILEEEALLLFEWSRAAEISADRTGLLCAGSVEDAASAMFKLASGLTGIPKDLVMSSMTEQFEQLKEHLRESKKARHAMPKDGEHEEMHHQEAFRTHPMIPIRFKSMEAASSGVGAILEVDGASGATRPAALIALDQRIEALLRAIEEEHTDRRGFQSAAGQDILCKVLLYVALSSGVLSNADRTWIRMTCDALPGDYSPEPLLNLAGTQDAASVQVLLVREIQASMKEELLHEQEMVMALEFASMMVSAETGKLSATYLIALDDLARALDLTRLGFNAHASHRSARRGLPSRAEIQRALRL